MCQILFFHHHGDHQDSHSFPTRRSSDLRALRYSQPLTSATTSRHPESRGEAKRSRRAPCDRSEEHTSELQSRQYLVCRLLLEKKKNISQTYGPNIGTITVGNSIRTSIRS